MLLITCPICRTRADETAFACGGEAHVARPQSLDPSSVPPDALSAYLHPPAQPPGWCRELWRCGACESWFVLLRHSVSNAVAAAYRPGDAPPPAPEDAA